MEGGLGLHLQSAVRWRDENTHRLGDYGKRKEEMGEKRNKASVQNRSIEG